MLWMLLSLLAAAAWMPTLQASLIFPHVIDSNMVLQRAPLSAHVWGTSSPSAVVALSIPSLKISLFVFASDVTGSFLFTLPPQPASSSHNITVSSDDGSVVSFTNVAFGDVFMCSGQSNMEFGLSFAFGAEAAIASSAQYADIRLFTIDKNPSAVPLNDTLDRFPATAESSWLPSSPDSVNGSTIDPQTTFYGYFRSAVFQTLHDGRGAAASDRRPRCLVMLCAPATAAPCVTLLVATSSFA